ncbi:putative Metallo-dependent phosphatase [Vibrio nigripulchritudo SOn1]|uniref:Phosphoesterase n=1 Tax=Vibrio nigripulchritudo SOn1 TaxID=1238450 RepID=A0AAV2VP56_9VIBR|nr:phosphodiesterase [Vibrio nigripulchritudo]CCO46482.1 putative Metallo-dependent phosphatase [Vibrio nigripulchritudo SOn1]
MRLFFASDLHGCAHATKKVIEAFHQSGCEHFLLLGDTLNHGPRNPVPDGYNPPEVAVMLNELSDRIIAVRGNCDSEVDQMLLNFPTLSDYTWVLLENGRRLFLTHGHIYNSNKRPNLKAGDVICHGHTHIPVAGEVDGVFIFNPGSTTFPRDGYQASYGLYENGRFVVQSFSGEVIVAGEM